MIGVQPTALGRRSSGVSGTQAQPGRSRRKAVEDHAYQGQKKKPKPTLPPPPWLCPPQKQPKVKHSLKGCVHSNIRLS